MEYITLFIFFPYDKFSFLLQGYILPWIFQHPDYCCLWLQLQFIFMTTVAFNSPVTYNGQRYPDWAHALGWIAALTSMICIPIGIIHTLSVSRGTLYQVCIPEITSIIYWNVCSCRFYCVLSVWSKDFWKILINFQNYLSVISPYFS